MVLINFTYFFKSTVGEMTVEVFCLLASLLSFFPPSLSHSGHLLYHHPFQSLPSIANHTNRYSPNP